MSSVIVPANVLLTGATGFVGSAVLANLLNKGFHVRAAVRSTAKAVPLESIFKSYVASGKLTFAVVPDITVAGAFDAALNNIDGVLHVASPLVPSDANQDPQELIDPAVKGTVGILQDAAKVASVKRVIITSSVVTLLEPKEGKYIYSEVDWFDTAPKLIEQMGASAPGGLKYVASKVLAERAALKWVEENKPTFEFVSVLPPYIFGKSILSDPGHIRPQASNSRLLSAFSNANKENFNYLETTDYADVLDVAEAHVRALTTPGIAGERIPLVAGTITWQDAFDVIAANPIKGLSVSAGKPGIGKNFVAEKAVSGENAVRKLGMTYRSLKDTLHDALTQAIEFGWKI